MRLRLAPKSMLVSEDAQRLLASGDIDELLRFHKNTFGALRMEDGDDEDDENADDTGDGEDDTDGSADGDSKKKDDKGGTRESELQAENAKRRVENKKLRSELDQMKTALKKFEDADKGELEKVTGSLTEITEERDGLADAVKQLRIENAFLTDNKHSWANPKAALRLADLSEVEIEDDGNVTGLREALDKLAKEEPYLLAKASSKDDDDEDDDDSKNGPTGQPQGRRIKGNPSRDKLIEKYPALRR